MKLLHRPRWRSGESWSGYLLRVADENRLLGIRGLADLVGCTGVTLVASSPRTVLPKFGLPTDQAPHISEEIPKRLKTGLYSSEVARNSITGLCAYCLRSDEVPFVRADWEFPLQVDCPQHGTALTRVCPSCKQDLRIYRSRLLYCDCGYALCNAESPQVNRQVAAPILYELLGIRGRDSTFSKIEPAEVRALFALQRIAHFEDHGDNAIRVKRARAIPYLTVEQLQKAEAWFSDWPHSFRRRFIRASWGHQQPGVRYVSADRLHLSQIHRLNDEISHLKRTTLEVLLEGEFVSIDGAATIAHQTPAIVRSWFDAGFLGTARLIRGQSKIPVKNLLDFLELTEATVSGLEAAQLLGVRPRAVYRLIDHKILSTVVGPSGAICRINKDAIGVFQDALLGSLTVESCPTGKVRSLAAIFQAHHKITPLKAYEAIRNGRLRVYAAGNSPALKDAYVYAGDYFRGIRASWEMPPRRLQGPKRVIHGDVHIARKGDEWVTLQAAQEIANVTGSVLKMWIDSGLLGKCKVSRRRPCVLLRNLLELTERIGPVVNVQEAARILGMTLKVPSALLRDGALANRGSLEACRVSAGELKELRDRLLMHAKPKQRPSSPRSARQLSSVLGSPFAGAVADALSAIQTGRLELYCSSNATEDLERMWVYERSYEKLIGQKYRHAKRPSRSLAVTCRRTIRCEIHGPLRGDELVAWGVAKKIARVTEFVLKQWVQAGLLKRIGTGRKIAVGMSDLLHAMQLLSGTLSASDTAAHLGVKRKGVYRLIEADEISVAVRTSERTMRIHGQSVLLFLSRILLAARPRGQAPERTRSLRTLFESDTAGVLVKALRCIRDGSLQIFHPADSAPNISNTYVDDEQYWVLMVGRNHAAALSRKTALHSG